MSFVDARGVRHSFCVYPSSALEAAATGLKQIRETEMIEDEDVLDLTIDFLTRPIFCTSSIESIAKDLSGMGAWGKGRRLRLLPHTSAD